MVTQLHLTGNKYNIALVCPSSMNPFSAEWMLACQTMYFIVSSTANDIKTRGFDEHSLTASVEFLLSRCGYTYLS